MVWLRDKFLPNNKVLALTKLKALPDNKFNVAKITISVFERVENIVEKRRKCIFFLFPQYFKKHSISELLKLRTMW